MTHNLLTAFWSYVYVTLAAPENLSRIAWFDVVWWQAASVCRCVPHCFFLHSVVSVCVAASFFYHRFWILLSPFNIFFFDVVVISLTLFFSFTKNQLVKCETRKSGKKERIQCNIHFFTNEWQLYGMMARVDARIKTITVVRLMQPVLCFDHL